MAQRHGAQFLRECFFADPNTGILIWRHRPAHHFKSIGCEEYYNRRGGEIVQPYRDSVGYRTVNVNSVHYRVHRIVWMLNRGDIPQGMHIDHINGDREDNRLCNLRLATARGNAMNSNRATGNSGLRGVRRTGNRWQAHVRMGGRKQHVGMFSTKGEAAVAAAKAAMRFHGEYSWVTSRARAKQMPMAA